MRAGAAVALTVVVCVWVDVFALLLGVLRRLVAFRGRGGEVRAAEK